MLQALKNSGQSLSEQTAKRIIDYIINDDIQPGDKLPNEAQLARQLNVGRSTVREAVKVLISRNIVEIVRGRGTFVTSRPGVANDPLGFDFVRDKRKLIMDMIEMRMIIEPQIAALAAKRATDEDIAALGALNGAVDQLIDAGQNHCEPDVAFHVRIAQASKNEVITSILPLLNQSVVLFSALTKKELLEHTRVTHRAILDAIIARDPQAAAAAMTSHLSVNRDRLLAIVSDPAFCAEQALLK